jgi:hypothetical protein
LGRRPSRSRVCISTRSEFLCIGLKEAIQQAQKSGMRKKKGKKLMSQENEVFFSVPIKEKFIVLANKRGVAISSNQ